MSGTLLTAYVLAALGGLLVLASYIDMMRRSISYDAASAMLIKLAQAHNLDRAAKLCKAAPGTILDAVVAALDRSKGATERSAVELAVFGAFDENGKRGQTQWLQNNQRGLLGVVLVAGAVGLALSANVLTKPLVGAVAVGGVAAMYLYVKRGYFAEAMAAMRGKVLPVFVEARIAEGEASAAAEAKKNKKQPSTIAKAELLARVATPDTGASPASPSPAASLQSGTCPLCKHTEIKTVPREDPRFRMLVCASCGYAQEFANLAAL